MTTTRTPPINKTYVETMEKILETVNDENGRLRDENKRLREENERVRYVAKDDGVAIVATALFDKAREVFNFSRGWMKKRNK